MIDGEFIELERRYDDLRTQLVRLKASVERIQSEVNRAVQDCAAIDEALYETQVLLDRIITR